MFYLIIMKYRSRTEITVLILEAANGGATKTKIMYKSFLSYAQLKEYFTMLIENALLEYEDGTIGIIQASWCWPYSVKDLQVFGEKDQLHAVNGNTLIKYQSPIESEQIP